METTQSNSNSALPTELVNALVKYEMLTELRACIMNPDVITSDSTFKYCTGENLSVYETEAYRNGLRKTYPFLNDPTYGDNDDLIKVLIDLDKLETVVACSFDPEIITNDEKFQKYTGSRITDFKNINFKMSYPLLNDKQQ